MIFFFKKKKKRKVAYGCSSLNGLLAVRLVPVNSNSKKIRRPNPDPKKIERKKEERDRWHM